MKGPRAVTAWSLCKEQCGQRPVRSAMALILYAGAQLVFFICSYDCATSPFSDGTVSADFGELWINGFGGIATASSGYKLLWRSRECGWSHYQAGVVRNEAFKQAGSNHSHFFIVWPFLNNVICTDRAKSVLERFRIDELVFKKRGGNRTPQQNPKSLVAATRQYLPIQASGAQRNRSALGESSGLARRHSQKN
jgi:hypothetical protein